MNLNVTFRRLGCLLLLSLHGVRCCFYDWFHIYCGSRTNCPCLFLRFFHQVLNLPTHLFNKLHEVSLFWLIGLLAKAKTPYTACSRCCEYKVEGECISHWLAAFSMQNKNELYKTRSRRLKYSCKAKSESQSRTNLVFIQLNREF